MAAANWRTLKKLDAHIHILPDAVHTANPDADDVWMYADLRQYVQIMRENHIERAVIMPFNDPFLMSMEFTADAVHRNLPGYRRFISARFRCTIIARSSRLHRSGAFPSPFIPIRMRRMICRRPEEIYASYCEILDQMDFTPEEAAGIAYKNAVGLLG